MKKTRVLIIDDSAVVRQTLESIINADPRLEVMGTASDPFFAAAKIKKEVPDVITLDVEMPRMDGITFLKTLMSQCPIPVVIISSLTANGTQTALKALEYGAVEVLSKPQLGNTKKFLEEASIKLCDTIQAASMAHVKRVKLRKPIAVAAPPQKIQPKHTADAVIQSSSGSRSMIKTTDKVIAVGASTGGTEALRVFLESLPHDAPGVVIVQHMPEHFTKSFADRLNTLCKVTVKEAVNNDTVIPGRVLIAPGNKHMLLKRSGARYYVEIKDGPLVNRHRPSVDVLFRSTAQYAGANSIGIIMTGMGDDGARGLLEMKQAGARTIAQDEKSCVVFGMPKEAIKLEAADKIVALDKISSLVMSMV
ncbi:MAG: chemotaxis response regulator protein-glutamate methylesterase [Cyclobacteriaceae bacterium]